MVPGHLAGRWEADLSPACRIPEPPRTSSQLSVSCWGLSSDSHRSSPWRGCGETGGWKEVMRDTNVTHCPERKEARTVPCAIKTAHGKQTHRSGGKSLESSAELLIK